MVKIVNLFNNFLLLIKSFLCGFILVFIIQTRGPRERELEQV